MGGVVANDGREAGGNSVARPLLLFGTMESMHEADPAITKSSKDDRANGTSSK